MSKAKLFYELMGVIGGICAGSGFMDIMPDINDPDSPCSKCSLSYTEKAMCVGCSEEIEYQRKKRGLE